MFEVAGLAFSGVGLASQLSQQISDWFQWKEQPIVVDRNWLNVAIDKDIILGPESDFRWVSEENEQTKILSGEFDTVIIYNENDRVKSRVTRPGLVLMRRRPEENTP